MNTSINQLYSFSIFLMVGVSIAILFDIFRILRKSFKTNDIITYIEDIVFWIVAGIILLYSIFTFNNGELRIYIFIAMGLGVLFYILFVSKYFIKVNVKVITMIKKVVKYIIRLLIRPILFCAKIIKKIFRPISFIFINFKKVFQNKLSKSYIKIAKKRN